MNERSCNSSEINRKGNGNEISLRNNYYVLKSQSVEDERSSKTKYGTFIWLLDYTKLFVTRLAKDLVISMLSYVYSGQLLPNHIIDLMHTQKNVQAERELVTATYRSSSNNDISTNSIENERGTKVNSDLEIISIKIASSFQEKLNLSDTSADLSNIFSARVHGMYHSPTEVTESLLRSELDIKLKIALEFLHRDNDFLIAAEIGDELLLEKYIKQGENVQQMDHLGRNALHLAVCSENEHAIKLLLDAGVNPNQKDNVGMTPLSLNLMRSPSCKIATLLFNYGAQILPRVDATDSGLFLQFLMLCKPSEEEEEIIKLMIEKGSLINDPEAPGGRQALHFAAMSDNCKLIKLLVHLGADLHLINDRNQTPLDVAYTFMCKEAILCINIIENGSLNEILSADSSF